MDPSDELRRFLELLFKHRIKIILITLAGAALAASLSIFILPAVYEAEAILVFRPPLYRLNLDERVQTNPNLDFQFYQAIPGLARSDTTLMKVFNSLEPSDPPEFASLEALRLATEVVYVRNDNVVNLKVTAQDPQLASQIANSWAESLLEEAIKIYGESDEQVRLLEVELSTAVDQRALAQQALIDFQARNQAPLLEIQLTSAQETYLHLLNDRSMLRRILANVQSLQSLISTQSGDQLVNLGDELTIILLELQAFTPQSAQVQLQINGLQTTSVRTTGDTLVFLDDLYQTIDASLRGIDSQITPLEAQIPVLQEQIEEYTAEEDRLQQDYDLSKTIYTTLANKIAESKISIQTSGYGIRIASRSAVPSRPAGPNHMFIILLGGAAGFFMGLVISLVAGNWWRDQPDRSSQQ